MNGVTNVCQMFSHCSNQVNSNLMYKYFTNKLLLKSKVAGSENGQKLLNRMKPNKKSHNRLHKFIQLIQNIIKADLWIKSNEINC